MNNRQLMRIKAGKMSNPSHTPIYNFFRDFFRAAKKNPIVIQAPTFPKWLELEGNFRNGTCTLEEKADTMKPMGTEGMTVYFESNNGERKVISGLDKE